MRSLISALLIAALLAGGAVAYGVYIEHTADTLRGYTDKINNALEHQQLDSAKELALELSEQISERKEALSSICDHKDIYEIQRLLAELSCFLSEEALPESKAHCAAVLMLLDKLSENTAPTLFNIL